MRDRTVPERPQSPADRRAVAAERAGDLAQAVVVVAVGTGGRLAGRECAERLCERRP